MELAIIPEINPLSMVYKPSGAFFADTIPAHEEQVDFCQKVQFSDVMYMIFALPSDSIYTPTAGLYNCLGELEASYTMTELTQSVTTEYDFFQVDMQFLGAIGGRPIDEGVYNVRLLLTGPTDPSDIYTFESEPIYVKETWPATVLLKYRNEINDFDIPFEDITYFYFRIRIEGGFPSPGYKPESKDQIFIDQNHVPVMLDSIPYNVRQIQFGAGCGIPNWQANAINRSLSCTHWYVDGVRYCKNEGAKLEPTHSQFYPMSGWVIDVIGVSEDYGSAFNLSKIYVLGSGDIAFASGPDVDMIVAPPIG